MGQKAGSLKRSIKFNKTLRRLTEEKKKRRHESPISRIKWEVPTDPTDIERTTKEHCTTPHMQTCKSDNSDELDQLPNEYKPTQLIHHERGHLKILNLFINSPHPQNPQAQTVSLETSTRCF